MRSFRRRLGTAVGLCVVVAALGCQQLTQAEDDDGSSSAPATSGGTFGGTFMFETSGVPQTSGDEGPSPEECNPVNQTGCADGEKCTALRSGGSISYGCVEDSSNLEVFDACSPDLSSGMDGCPPGSVCLADETGAALCVPLCIEDGDCDLGVCLTQAPDLVPYCASECSPFQSDCPSPLQCRRLEIRFACKFGREGDIGTAGAPCAPTDDAGCAPGFVCLPGALVPDCGDPDCCASVCDLSEPTECTAPAVCEELLENPAPGFEEIGACFVPA